ncbi:MAG: sulfatase-like hydrolase/transferase [Planctomycetota bacterium]
MILVVPFGSIHAAEQAAGSSSNSKSQPPNIVFILTDDLGYGDVGCFGSKIKTPNIDRLAKEGMTFTDFYVHNRCSPTRLAFMTGSNADRAGFSKVIYRSSKVGINPDEITTPELLKKAGYATALVGKWHLGDWEPFHPNQHGFDLFLGFLGNGEKNSQYGLYRNKELIEHRASKTDGIYSQMLLDEGIDFIKKNKDNPFFLYYSSPLPHTPWKPSERFKGTSPVGTYGDVIREIDWQVGELMKTLDELGLAENTLVVFTSDNGPVLRAPGPSAGMLRGGKWSDFEGGVRVPCLMRWPARIEAGARNSQITTIFDMLPTFCEIADVPVPDDRVIDGRSIVHYLDGKTLDEPIHDAFILHGSTIRVGNYKLFMKSTNKGGGIEGPLPPTQKGTLFDLKADPGETKDISAERKDIVKDLILRMEQAKIELKENARKIGQLEAEAEAGKAVERNKD